MKFSIKLFVSENLYDTLDDTDEKQEALYERNIILNDCSEKKLNEYENTSVSTYQGKLIIHLENHLSKIKYNQEK